MADFRPDDPTIRGQTGGQMQLGNPGMVQEAHFTSGVVRSQPMTFVGAGQDTIPAFLNGLVEPYVKQKQTEMYYKGMADQMAAGAETEMLDHNGTWVDSVFGPTGYREGATAFRALSAVSNKEIELTERMDDLKRLPPDELNKVLADEMHGMLTGDKWVDTMVQGEMTKKLGPLLNGVAKERLAQQQFDARQEHTGMLVKGAAAYQLTATRQSKLSAPTEEETLASATAQQNFFNLMPKPYGMTDKAYRESVKDAYGLMLQQGNFYAAEAIRGSGLLQQGLDVKDMQAMDDQYDRYSKKALETNFSTHSEDIAEIDRQIGLGLKTPGQISAMYHELNAKMRKETGVDDDYFSGKDIASGNRKMIDAVISRAERNSEQAIAKGDKEAEAAANVSLVEGAFKTGQIISVRASHTGLEGLFDDYAVGLKNAKDGAGFGQLAQAANMGYVAPSVKDMFQAPIRASIGVGYSKDAERGLTEFRKLAYGPGGSLAAASQYYGDYFLRMVQFDNQVKGGVNNLNAAWQGVFGDGTSDPNKEGITPKQRKEAETAVATYVGNLPKTEGWLGRDASETSAARLTTALSEDVGKYVRAGLQPSVAVAAAYTEGKASGRIEQFGEYGWVNPGNTTPLSTVLQLPEKETAILLRQEIDALKKANGWAPQGKEGYTIFRRPDNRGLGDISVTFRDEHGHSSVFLVTTANLKLRAGTNTFKQMTARYHAHDADTPGTGLIGH